ncbi:hypothetical protein F5879DRAFT_313802 [Lentinula edodes]|nr:hypothetical protein F5879DRAFT_313802 [Lentinula edodes]
MFADVWLRSLRLARQLLKLNHITLGLQSSLFTSGAARAPCQALGDRPVSCQKDHTVQFFPARSCWFTCPISAHSIAVQCEWIHVWMSFPVVLSKPASLVAPNHHLLIHHESTPFSVRVHHRYLHSQPSCAVLINRILTWESLNVYTGSLRTSFRTKSWVLTSRCKSIQIH